MTGKRPRRWLEPIVVSGASAREREGAAEAAPSAPIHASALEGVSLQSATSARPPRFVPRRAQRAVAPAPPEPRHGERSAGLSSAALALSPPALSLAPVRRALVVDDDPEVRRALARFLRPELDVRLAASLSDAWGVLAELDRLDVAFVDWELPDGTGEQLLERLSRWPDAIRVLISARFPSSAAAAVATGEKPAALFSGNPLRNRALANLVLGKPLATSVIEALKRAALAPSA